MNGTTTGIIIAVIFSIITMPSALKKIKEEQAKQLAEKENKSDLKSEAIVENHDEKNT